MSKSSFKIYKVLYPLSWIYAGITSVRNKLFDWGKLQSKSFNIPIICIGNLSVGGTGKTPHAEYIVQLLYKEFAIAVLSRGYKRKTKGYVLSNDESTVKEIGDEPYQIKSKFPTIRVAVDENRCHGIEQLLLLNSPKIDVILLDDAYQHRYVNAGLNILLTDYHRLFCDDKVIPAGRLRESSSGKQRAQIVIVTKCPINLQPEECNIITQKLNLFPHQQLYFSAFQYGDLQVAFPKSSNINAKEIANLGNWDVLLVTGIASPKPLIDMLSKQVKHLETLSFSDHHNFNLEDMEDITRAFNKLKSNNRIIITTEKDATRLCVHPNLSEELKPYIYIQPIEVKILQNQQDIFNQQIISYVRKNSRNSSFFKSKDA